MMWNSILDVAGWGLFYLVLIFFVRWIGIEREFFASQDPERWEPEPPSESSPADAQVPKPGVRLPFISSLGRPA
jgi:hypothetical protein